MIVNISNDTYNLPDGTYLASVKSIQGYDDEKKALVKLELESTGETFIKTYDTSELGEYPWGALLKALDTNETDNLIGHKIEFVIKNHTSQKSGAVFSNIKQIRLIE